ncbi:hypothetical protein HDV06_002298 [Boothiomyces sp. JEL0866]|nr:hypothetical protein HDV06_002298 [Boothiomyces sp. JEL0866]
MTPDGVCQKIKAAAVGSPDTDENTLPKRTILKAATKNTRSSKTKTPGKTATQYPSPESNPMLPNMSQKRRRESEDKFEVDRNTKRICDHILQPSQEPNMNMNSFLPALQESLRGANNSNSFVDRSSEIPDSAWNFSEINSAVATPTIAKTTAIPHEDLIANLMTLAQKRVDEEKYLHLNIKAAKDLALDLEEHDKNSFEISIASWKTDLERESILTKKRNANLFQKDDSLTPLSRWVLLSWIKEVIVEQRMFRQTFHATVQYMDILFAIGDFGQEFFQLIAVTALLVALKANETFHLPMEQLVEFLYDEDLPPEVNNHNQAQAKKFLLKWEFKLMMNMDWNILLPTAQDFLKHAYQFATVADRKRQPNELPGAEEIPMGLFDSNAVQTNSTFFHPRYNSVLFAKACTLLDKAIMDSKSCDFLSSELAAAVFWRSYPKSETKDQSEYILLACTGYELEQLSNCLEFLQAYHMSDITEIINSEFVTSMIAHNSEKEETQFRIEDHQLPLNMESSDFDKILSDRAKKLGSFHAPSFW